MKPGGNRYVIEALLGVICVLLTAMIAAGWQRFDATDVSIHRVEVKVDATLQEQGKVRERLGRLETIHDMEGR